MIFRFILFFLFLWLRQSRRKFQNYGLGLLIGGAISNVIDRVFYGAVFDFIDLHAFGYHWPAFNLADTAVVCGVFVILLESFFFSRSEHDYPESIP